MSFKVKIILLSIIILVLGYLTYKIATFEIFEVELNEIAVIEIPNRSYKIGLYFLPTNASSQSCIQIRKLNTDTVLRSYERFNFVEEYKLSNDTLRLVITDSSSFLERKFDTAYFKLP